MILNITPDDKFVPFLQGLFEEAVPGQSLWRVYTDKLDLTFAVKADGMEIVNAGYFGSEKFKKDLQISNSVIIHSLSLSSLQKLLFLSKIPQNMPIIWRGWGSDYYGILQANGLPLMLPETSSLSIRPGILKRLPDILKRIFVKQFPRKLLNALLSKFAGQRIDKKIIARFDYFSCCVPDDFEALKRVLPYFKAQFLPLNYYSTEDVLLRGDDLQDLTGCDILLGNSATATNNHIEAIRILSGLGMHGRKVVMPLSYGDMEYQQKIIQAGDKLLGESFVSLTNYMSLHEYNKAISSCSTLIMNHIRQQAIGNISSALLRGGKVYLRPENPIYKYYTRIGVKLYLFSDGITVADLDATLNKDDAQKNREIMMGMWSRAQGITQVKTISRLGTRV